MAGHTHSLSTDKPNKVTLDSRLVYAEWRQAVVYGGQEAGLEVATSFVGQGARIRIKGKSEKGKKLGKIDSTIRNNKYVGALHIPDDIEYGDSVYFEVKIPDNKLKGKSSHIPAYPLLTVSNMKWNPTEARRGDTVTLSAEVDGCLDNTDAQITIREYDADGAHDRIARIPANVVKNKIEVTWEYEYHEDTEDIPTQDDLKKYGGTYNPPEYFFVVDINGQKFGERRESGLLLFKDWIEIEAKNVLGEPLRSRKYTITLPDGTEKKGTLDGDGYARADGIPPGLCSITIQPAGDGS
jgi:hypothetical protein